jgi:hypothetical protein
VRPLQEKFDDRWCHVLSWSEHDTLWLDMERGGVLVARETFHPKTGVLMQRYELSRHEEVAPKIWIPKKLRNIQFDFSAKTEEGQKRRVIDGFFDVEEIEVNTLSESDFDFTPPAGALLTYDAQNPNAKYPYQSVTGGEELLDRLANWIRTMNPHKQIKVTTNNIFGWFVGGFVVPIIIFLEIRKRKKKR